MSGITIVYYPRLLPSFTITVVLPSFTTAVYCHRSVTVYVLLSVCWNILKGTPPNPPRGSRGCRPRPPLVDKKSMYFRTCIFINIFSILAPIWAPFWSMFPDLCIIFSSIEVALIFYRFLTDSWYSWSCKKRFERYTMRKNQEITGFEISKICLRFCTSFWHNFGSIFGIYLHTFPT